MKTIRVIIFLISFATSYSISHIEIKQNVESLYQHGDNEGREFILAFPLNDSERHPKENLAVYVTSRFDTEVTISNSNLGLNQTKEIVAGKITEFSSIELEQLWDLEIIDFETPIKNGLIVKSKDPVKVYAFNSKRVSSEGYMAIPTRKWGTEYIHNSSYDFYEVTEWGGGFVVIANEDDTEVNIELVDGANKEKGFGQTTGGRQHGNKHRVILNRGDVYAIQGSGETRRVFDLSGSKISSDKPIGLISYHNRTMIPPTVVTSGRDYIIEMMPPISSWGTEYFSVEFDRKKDKGDFFRVIAGDDKVIFTIDWYDKNTNELIDQIGPITLAEKGDFFEYNVKGATIPHNLSSIRGVAHFKANGPILVCQYAFSANYDGAGGNYDPFMIVLPSVEQFTEDCIFQTPRNYGRNSFINNSINVVIKGDSKDLYRNLDLMNSLKINSKKIVHNNPNFFKNIPGTDYFWARIELWKAGAYKIEADTKFGVILHGYASFDSYGWPATKNAEDLINVDTISPKIEIISDNKQFIFKVSDKPKISKNGLKSFGIKEYSVGMNSLPLLKSSSRNFSSPKLVDEMGYHLHLPEWINQQEYYFSVEVIDTNDYAVAELSVSDKNYNETEIKIIYNNSISSVDNINKGNIIILNQQPITENQLHLELPKYLNKTITLSDIEGNILRTLEANSNQISIDISDLSSGAYFINISDGKSQVTKKFMIER